MPPPTVYAKADSQIVLTSSDYNSRRSDYGRSYSSSSSTFTAGSKEDEAKKPSKASGMDMEIQPVPWWNRRSRMERRFFVIAVTLLLLAVGLAVGLTTLLYKNYELEHNFSQNSDIINSHQTTAAFTAEHPLPTTQGSSGGPIKSADNFCMTKGCVKTAADILTNMDESVNPCKDFYRFACGGFMERTSIPDDRTRISSFSVLGDELLTQVRFEID